jgi:hypothetical protein
VHHIGFTILIYYDALKQNMKLVTILTDRPQIQVNKKAEVRRRTVASTVQTGVCNHEQMGVRVIRIREQVRT